MATKVLKKFIKKYILLTLCMTVQQKLPSSNTNKSRPIHTIDIYYFPAENEATALLIAQSVANLKIIHTEITLSILNFSLHMDTLGIRG